MTGPRPSARGASAAWRRDLRAALTRHRRLLAAGLLAGSTACAISVLAPAPPPTSPVAAAAHDLAGGTTITAEDLRIVNVPRESVPTGAIIDEAQLTGRVLAVPVRAGETITDVRLVGPALLAGYGERLVAAPVRIADAGSARLLQPGDVIDVLAADSATETAAGETAVTEARLVASGVRVVAVPREVESALSGASFEVGALVVLATTSQTAARLASAAVTSRLSLTITAG
ncbi:MAG: Flp pilus assembly protein CpaB [Sporichthyaceae bacterium]